LFHFTGGIAGLPSVPEDRHFSPTFRERGPAPGSEEPVWEGLGHLLAWGFTVSLRHIACYLNCRRRSHRAAHLIICLSVHQSLSPFAHLSICLSRSNSRGNTRGSRTDAPEAAETIAQRCSRNMLHLAPSFSSRTSSSSHRRSPLASRQHNPVSNHLLNLPLSHPVSRLCVPRCSPAFGRRCIPQDSQAHSRQCSPSGQPSAVPSTQPSCQPSSHPSGHPSSSPSTQPSSQPTDQPTTQPSTQPTSKPSGQPSSQPSAAAAYALMLLLCCCCSPMG
jgi:cell division septation protein DedD